ncbi:hypothetical protein SAN_2283 [Streptococcus agalactiae COH1]|nr:hypothetical protein SAN_2283 [Streptococcus agalactiae COH1]
MLDILSEKHLERRQRIIISAIAIALAAQSISQYLLMGLYDPNLGHFAWLFIF